MNKLQKTYIKIKAAYEGAFKAAKWEIVDRLEDQLLEAEFALVDWTFDEAVKTGKMSREDAEFIRRNSSNEQWEKIVDMGLRLTV